MSQAGNLELRRPPPQPATVPPDVRAAIVASPLRALPDDVAAALIADATRLTVPPGSEVRREGEPGAHLELVVDGLVRMYVVAPDGRTLTIRYCRPGAVMGTASLFVSGFQMRSTMQALVPSDVVVLRPGVVRSLVDRHQPFALALLEELSIRVVGFIGELHHSTFASIRQRLARHLLDIAAEHQQGSELVADVTQQELADAVGTVREVVARVLRDLRADGMVGSGRDRIVIVDPARLTLEVFPGTLARRPVEVEPRSQEPRTGVAEVPDQGR
jgi:CRP/FNR family transcriptional regulator